VKLVANPVVMQAAGLLFLICGILIIGAFAVKTARKDLVSDGRSLTASPRADTNNFALATCQSVIAGMKQNIQQLQNSVAEEKSRAAIAEASTNLLLENIETGVVLIGQNLLVQAANPAAKRLLGYQSPLNMHAKELFRGLRTVELPSTNGALTGISQAIRDVIANGAEYRGVPADYATPSGDARNFSLTLLPSIAQGTEAKSAICLIACGMGISARSGDQDRSTIR
jgi:hypothetical protein